MTAVVGETSDVASQSTSALDNNHEIDSVQLGADGISAVNNESSIPQNADTAPLDIDGNSVVNDASTKQHDADRVGDSEKYVMPESSASAEPDSAVDSGSKSNMGQSGLTGVQNEDDSINLMIGDDEVNFDEDQTGDDKKSQHPGGNVESKDSCGVSNTSDKSKFAKKSQKDFDRPTAKNSGADNIFMKYLESGEVDVEKIVGVWVSNITKEARANDLKVLFSKRGVRVTSAKIVATGKNSDARCFGLVTLANHTDAKTVYDFFRRSAHLPENYLNGIRIRVEYAQITGIGPLRVPQWFAKAARCDSIPKNDIHSNCDSRSMESTTVSSDKEDLRERLNKGTAGQSESSPSGKRTTENAPHHDNKKPRLCDDQEKIKRLTDDIHRREQHMRREERRVRLDKEKLDGEIRRYRQDLESICREKSHLRQDRDRFEVEKRDFQRYRDSTLSQLEDQRRLLDMDRQRLLRESDTLANEKRRINDDRKRFEEEKTTYIANYRSNRTSTSSTTANYYEDIHNSRRRETEAGTAYYGKYSTAASTIDRRDTPAREEGSNGVVSSNSRYHSSHAGYRLDPQSLYMECKSEANHSTSKSDFKQGTTSPSHRASGQPSGTYGIGLSGADLSKNAWPTGSCSGVQAGDRYQGSEHGTWQKYSNSQPGASTAAYYANTYPQSASQQSSYPFNAYAGGSSAAASNASRQRY